MITISADKLSEWKKKPFGEVSWHEWNDHNLAIDIRKKYDIFGYPSFIIIDSEGKILSKGIGLKNFSEALKKLLPAKDVDKIMDFKWYSFKLKEISNSDNSMHKNNTLTITKNSTYTPVEMTGVYKS